MSTCMCCTNHKLTFREKEKIRPTESGRDSYNQPVALEFRGQIDLVPRRVFCQDVKVRNGIPCLDRQARGSMERCSTSEKGRGF